MSISLKQRTNQAKRSNAVSYIGDVPEADLSLSSNLGQLVKFIELNHRLPHRGKGGDNKAISAARSEAVTTATALGYSLLDDEPAKQIDELEQSPESTSFDRLVELMESNADTVNHAFNDLTDMVTDKLEAMETKLSQRSNSNSNKQSKGTKPTKRSNSKAVKPTKRNVSGSKKYKATEESDLPVLHCEIKTGKYGPYGQYCRPYYNAEGELDYTSSRTVSEGDAKAILEDLGQDHLIDEDPQVGGTGSVYVDFLLNVVWINE
jgi:hypothetical protein